MLSNNDSDSKHRRTDAVPSKLSLRPREGVSRCFYCFSICYAPPCLHVEMVRFLYLFAHSPHYLNGR